MRQIDQRPCGSRLLQPLREIGLPEKTQCWDLEDIQAAIREAYAQGIPVESLYGTGNRAIKPCVCPKPALQRRTN